MDFPNPKKLLSSELSLIADMRGRCKSKKKHQKKII